MPDSDARLASDLSLAVMRLARQLRFRNAVIPVSLSQLSALATLANEGAMTPGALAIRERVRPPSMTRVIASLADMGLVDRAPHPVDGRQVLVAVSAAGAELVRQPAGPARNGWPSGWRPWTASQRDILRKAADLMTALVDEGP